MEEEEDNSQEYNMNVYDQGPSSGNIEYYRKIEKITKKTTTNISNEGSDSKQYTSLTNKNYSNGNQYKYEYERGNKYDISNYTPINTNQSLNLNLNLNQDELKLKSNETFSSKQKYSYGGRVQEKNNYLLYVSGIGYVDKDGNPQNKEKKEKTEIKETKVVKNITKPKPKPKPKIETVVIKETKEDTGERELIDNYQYHETKDI